MKFRPAPTIVAAFLLALLLLAGVSAISFLSTMRMTADAKLVEHTHEVMAVIERLVKIVSYDAVSHRGFLITGNEELFLAKHQQALLDRDAAMADNEFLGVGDQPSAEVSADGAGAGIEVSSADTDAYETAGTDIDVSSADTDAYETAGAGSR